MSDIHYNEIKLSRELANVIKDQLERDHSSVPESVRIAYNRLLGEYIRQQQSEQFIP